MRYAHALTAVLAVSFIVGATATSWAGSTNFHSSRSNKSSEVDTGGGDATISETSHAVVSEEGIRFPEGTVEGDVTQRRVRQVGPRIEGDEATTGNIVDMSINEKGVSQKAIYKGVGGDDNSDSINMVVEEGVPRDPKVPSETILPPIQMGDEAVAPINATQLSAVVSGNMKKREPVRPRRSAARPDRRIHGNQVSDNRGLTTTVMTTGDFTSVQNSTSVSVGTIGMGAQ